MDRETHLAQLEEKHFDLLVIGGGATGAGILLDATSRGLEAALVEKSDFASGTSSRSTKLLHGGVRYLERAVLDLDRGQYDLVKEALKERAILLRIAPHLTRYIPLLTPLYHRTEIPYYYAGLKMYDWLAGDGEAPPSRYISAEEALAQCPMLKKEGLKGGVVYSDGQFDDARMALSIVLRASELGASAANHVEITGLKKDKGRIVGAQAVDRLSGKSFTIRAKVVVNATGPLADSLRQMDQPTTKPLLKASSGAHIVLDRDYSPPEMGLLIPKTEDGRVLFLLPWLGHTLVGTTDNPAEVEEDPKASEQDVAYILRQLKRYFSLAVSEKEILAKWSGLRPLIQKKEASSTAKLSREHAIEVSPSGLVTIAGGKWTTYRKMALDTVEEAIEVGQLQPTGPSKTQNIYLAGGAAYSIQTADDLHQKYGWPLSQCRYLNHAYGDRCTKVAQIAEKGFHHPLLPQAPYLEAEVIYGARFESARTSLDILCRRLRVAFLNKKGALAALPRVQDLLQGELGWDEKRKQADRTEALTHLNLL